ncbi:MAG: sensor histidine kinase [Bacteroidetes bacterium]|nr:sensor histidine kinase [Bacteroidota bacterium]
MKKPFSITDNYVFHAVGWIILYLISVLTLSNLGSLSFAIIHTSFQMVIIIGLFYFNTRFLIKRYFEKSKIFQYILAMTLTSFLVIVARFWIIKQINFKPIDAIISPQNRFITLTVLTTVLTVVFSSFYQIIQNRYLKEKQHLQIIAEQKEAQLQFLRGQINPHFLFNTLNNIYSMAVSKSDHTPKVILQLSKLLRYVIYESQKEKVCLRQEIEQIERFIEIFQIRFEKAQNIKMEVKGSPEQREIEPMVLIPLVENCFKHYYLENESETFIKINIFIFPEKLIFETHNSYSKDDTQKDKVGGVGLLNIKRRLELSYPDKHSLSINRQESIFSVLLTIDFV